ncbi:MAG TPA: hypothetical protein VEY71_08605, partial [Chitinophagales bacterium]|nr:hypothetical protein [Chitinophagales bacterium]
LLLPYSWSIASNVYWDLTDTTAPFKYNLSAVNPNDRLERIDFYPSAFYITTNDASYGVASKEHQGGPRYSPVLPQTALDAIRNFLIPAYRPGVHDLRVVEQLPLSNIEPLDSARSTVPRETGLVRVKYAANGQMVEEVFFAVLRKAFRSSDGYNTVCEWHVEQAASCSGREGSMDVQLPRLQTAMLSMRYSDRWLEKHQPALSGRSGDTSQQRIMALRLRLHRSLYQAARALSRYEHGVDYFVDKTGDFVALPSGYVRAWRNETGMYVLSDATNYELPKTESMWFEIKRIESVPASGVYNPEGAYNQVPD